MTKLSALALAASLALAPMVGYASAATTPAKPATTTHHVVKKPTKTAQSCKMEKGKDGKSHKVCTPVKPVAHKTTTKKPVKKV
ncbi:hypothetical protein [Aestuariivirga sp.]|uniref:hypothetical protein n=1 Tax=Aestuariivirga sp. TaxID=2650926 RepID=UPI0039E4371B